MNEREQKTKLLRRLLGERTQAAEEVRRALLHAITRNHGSSEGCHECALIDTYTKDAPAP